MLHRYFQKYTGFLRSLKWAYVINNLLNINKLQHNKSLYRRYGLRKSIVAPVGSKDFEKLTNTDIPWLDQPDPLPRLEQHPAFATFSPEIQEQMRRFVKDGYMILDGFYAPEETDALNREVDEHLASGQTGYNYTGRKIINFFEQSRLANERYFRNPEILRMLSFLQGKPVIPFQTLNFTLGSEQRAHSDAIHMMTEPKGYLIATWTALEDCTLENGPLQYYPGSHRLPYITTQDYPSGNTALTIGEHSNRLYEDRIAQLIKENGLKPQTFLAKRGDVLVWHSNLLHAGSPITRAGATRKSMVCHYYAEDVICYHEMSQRPALLPAPGQPN